MSIESKQALLSILNTQYQHISGIEEEWGIHFKEGDQRPRIDYFHDAVRALTSGSADLYTKHSRLSVEHLAYDLSQLRQIQAKPLGVGFISRPQQPAGYHEVATMQDVQRMSQHSPDRKTRADLAQLYKDYAVMFAAVFAETADINFKARCDEIDSTVQDIGTIEQVLQQLANGKLSKQQAMSQLDQVEMDSLRERIIQAVSSQTIRHAEQEVLAGQLAQFEKQLDAEKKTIETAHLHYVTGQLAVYEGSKDIVKRLASQGLNLAGKFVENAMARSQGGQGKGQGF